MEPLFGIVTPVVAVVVLIIALIILGPGKLPDVGRSLGKGIKELKDATNEVEEISTSLTETKSDVNHQNEIKTEK